MKKSLLFLVLLLGVNWQRSLARHKHPSREAIKQARLEGRTCVPLSDFIKLGQSGEGKTLKMYRTDCTVIAPARDGKPAVIQCVAHNRRVKHSLGLTRNYASSSQALNLTASNDSTLGSIGTLLPSDAALSAQLPTETSGTGAKGKSNLVSVGGPQAAETLLNEVSSILAEGFELKAGETVKGLATQIYDTLMTAYDKAVEAGKTTELALADARAACAGAYPSETSKSIEAAFASAEEAITQESAQVARAVPEIAQVSKAVGDAVGQEAAENAVTQVEAAIKQIEGAGQGVSGVKQNGINVGVVAGAAVGAAVATVLVANAADTLGFSLIAAGIMAAAMACSTRIQHPPTASITFCPAIDGINPEQYSLCVNYHKKRGIMGKVNIYFDSYSIKGPETDQIKKNLADAKSKVEQLKQQLAQAKTDDAKFPIKEQLKQATERVGYLSNSVIAVIPNAISIEKQQLDDIATELQRKLALACKLRSAIKNSQDASDLDITIKALERLSGEVAKKRKALSAAVNTNLQSFLLEGQEKAVQEGVQYQTDQQALKKKEAEEKVAAAKAALEAKKADEAAQKEAAAKAKDDKNTPIVQGVKNVTTGTLQQPAVTVQSSTEQAKKPEQATVKMQPAVGMTTTTPAKSEPAITPQQSGSKKVTTPSKRPA